MSVGSALLFLWKWRVFCGNLEEGRLDVSRALECEVIMYGPPATYFYTKKGGGGYWICAPGEEVQIVSPFLRI